jgi:hypothetical protein
MDVYLTQAQQKQHVQLIRAEWRFYGHDIVTR